MTGYRVDKARNQSKNDQAERLAEHVQRLVNDAPPLSPEQRYRLALLLRPAVEVR